MAFFPAEGGEKRIIQQAHRRFCNMNTIIQIEKDSRGAHPVQQRSDNFIPEGFIAVPEKFSEKVWESRGFCELTFKESEEGIKRIKSVKKTSPPPLPPTQRRARAYAEEETVEWFDRKITVDAANELWMRYAAEGSPHAETLTERIREAKRAIRRRIG